MDATAADPPSHHRPPPAPTAGRRQPAHARLESVATTGGVAVVTDDRDLGGRAETVPRRGYRLAIEAAGVPPHGTNPVAYDLYLQGRYLWNRRPGDVVWQSLECFRRAIELDASFAPAWAGIADVYSTLGSWEPA